MTSPSPHEAFSILDLITHAHTTAAAKGFWDGQVPEAVLPEKVALMHSELQDALEAWCERSPGFYLDADGKPEGALVELADCMIRIADYVGALRAGPAFLAALAAKLQYNASRPHKHEKRA